MSQANILVFDTATIACTVALKTKKGISSRHIEQANCHSQYLLDMIQQLLSESEITLSQIDYLVVGVGPGSFTGLRIGIGIAQSLAYTNNITLLTMSTLEFIAVSASSDIGLSNQDSLVVAHDARMHEIYMASYSMNFEMKKFELMHPIKLFSPDQLNNQLNNQVFSKDGRVFLCGNAWKVYEKEIFQSDQELGGFLEIETPNAEKVILYVEKNLQHHLKVAWKDLNAEYIRDDIAKKSQKALI